MDKYLLVYYGGSQETDSAKAKAVMADWMKWFGELGKGLVDGGAPTMPGKVVNKKSTKAGFLGEQPVTGYSIIQAANIDEAVKMVKGCPILNSAGGQIAVYPTMQMQM